MTLDDCYDIIDELNAEFSRITFNHKFKPFSVYVDAEDNIIKFLGYDMWHESHLEKSFTVKSNIKEFVKKEAFYFLDDFNVYYKKGDIR